MHAIRFALLAPFAFAATVQAAPPPPAPSAAPPVYVVALPAAVSLVAWLPVKKAPDLADLDLRVEVVLPADCGDRIAGLLRESDAAYQVVVERHAAGECGKKA